VPNFYGQLSYKHDDFGDMIEYGCFRISDACKDDLILYERGIREVVGDCKWYGEFSTMGKLTSEGLKEYDDKEDDDKEDDEKIELFGTFDNGRLVDPNERLILMGKEAFKKEIYDELQKLKEIRSVLIEHISVIH